jgi:hypothetical protein
MKLTLIKKKPFIIYTNYLTFIYIYIYIYIYINQLALYLYVKNIMLRLSTPLSIISLLSLHFLSLLNYLPITYILSINRSLCIHYQY